MYHASRGFSLDLLGCAIAPGEEWRHGQPSASTLAAFYIEPTLHLTVEAGGGPVWPSSERAAWEVALATFGPCSLTLAERDFPNGTFPTTGRQRTTPPPVGLTDLVRSIAKVLTTPLVGQPLIHQEVL